MFNLDERLAELSRIDNEKRLRLAAEADEGCDPEADDYFDEDEEDEEDE